MSRRGIAVFLFAAALAATTFAQEHPNIRKGFAVDSVYQSGDIDHVNAFNGNLIARIPIGPRFQVGADLSYGLTLTYNSKVWEYEGALGGNLDLTPRINVLPTSISNAGLGWQLTLGRILLATHPANKTGRHAYESADGAQHAIYCTLHQDEMPQSAGACAGLDVDPGMVQGYTRDGTYLRMKIEPRGSVGGPLRASIEFPNGTKHIFEDAVSEALLRPVRMQDRFNNQVNVAYSGTAQAPIWTITDSASASRKIVVKFEASPSSQGLPKNYQTRVARVEVSQFGTSTLAGYDFDYYDNPTVTRGCIPPNFDYPFGSSNPRVSELRWLTLPTGHRYEFEYFNSPQFGSDGCGSGVMSRMTLPTRGRIEYTYRAYELPTSGCTRESVLNKTAGIGKRTVVDTARNTRYEWTYVPSLSGISSPWPCSRNAFPSSSSTEGKTTVTEVQVSASGQPTTRQTSTHYFSLWSLQSDSPDGFKREEYGLPLTRATQRNGLSTEVELGNKTTSTYVEYEMDPPSKNEPVPVFSLDRNRRLKSTRTVFDDNKSSETTFSDFDGLGHYRTVVSTGFPGGSRTTTTTYNPGKSIPQPVVGRLDLPPTMPHDAEWLLETYQSRTVTEGSSTLVTQYCFDALTGFLDARRTLKGTTAGADDLLAVFTHDSNGNVDHEKYYGGDGTKATSASGCNPKAGESPQYDIAHTYEFGTLKTTEAVGSGFFSIDNRDAQLRSGIDPHTGFVSHSRDTGGLVTRFTYDALGRLETIEPQPNHGPKFSYDYTVDTKSPYVSATASNSSGATVDQKFVRFDALGRLWMEFDLLPAPNAWSLRAVEYDSRNRQTKVLQRQLSSAANPAGITTQPTGDATTSTYDYLGRPLSITQPDASTITYSYSGASAITETVRRGNVDGTSSRAASVTRSYDWLGRLRQVDEFSGNTSAANPKGSQTSTVYTYDAGDRLVSVTMGGKQPRSFIYDGRGFVRKETHPENGDTTYDEYDARGNPGERVNGGVTLEFDYDRAGRLETVTDQGKVIKKFTFGQQADGMARGKLLTATRRNDLPSGKRIDVTETYEYGGAAGQMSRRTTLIEDVAGASRTPIKTVTYDATYDDLLLNKDIIMPTCAGCTIPEGVVSTVTNTRTAGFVTSVNGFADLTYHPSGNVNTVAHVTPGAPTDTYSQILGMPRPSKITFSLCSNPQPAFDPGHVVVKANPVEGGLQIEWPKATVCGGSGAVTYKVYRDGQPISVCLTTMKYVDKSAVLDVAYSYHVEVEGPTTNGGRGSCRQGLTARTEAVSGTLRSLDTQTILTVPPVTAYVGVPATYRAVLTSANGPVRDELLTFVINGQFAGTVRTAGDGSAAVVHLLDLPPRLYENGVRVIYSGGVLPSRTTTANLSLSCGLPSYTIKPTSLNVPKESGSYGIYVGTSDHCGWTPTFNPSDFLTVSPTSERRGIGSFDIHVPLNETVQARSANVDVANRQVSVVQSGPDCTYRFSPEIAYVPAESYVPPGQIGPVVTMDIATPENCAWTVSSNSPWVQFQKPPGNGNPTSGVGPRAIYFTVSQNVEPTRRTAQLTLFNGAGQEVAHGSVNQRNIPLATCPGPLLYDLRGGEVSSKGQYVPLRVYTEQGTELRYRWWANGRIMIDACTGCDNIIVYPGSQYYPGPGQAVTYQVEVYNNCGYVMSEPATWSNSTPPESTCNAPAISDGWIYEAPRDVLSPRPGATVGLWAVGRHSDPSDASPFTYKWYLGMAGDRSNEIAHNPTWPIDTIYVSPHATSFYWVEITDKCGSNISRAAKVEITQPPTPRRRVVRHDFTGDGRDDVVWQNPTTHQNELWSMNGTVHAGTIPLATNSNPDALIQSTGDLDADGNADLFWRDPKTGQNEVWLMSRTQLAERRPLEGRPGEGWTIGAVSDYDDDQNDDIVWHDSATGANEIWFQSGAERAGSWALPNSGVATGVYGSGDFSGDEKPDLFLHNAATGENVVWVLSDGETQSGLTSDVAAKAAKRQLRTSVLALPPSTDMNQVPALVADMNGDGRPDIVWRNKATGENSVWVMNGTQVSQTVAMEPRTDLTWQVGGGGSGTTDPTPDGGGTPGGSATSIGVSADPTSVGKPAAVTATLMAGNTAMSQRRLIFSVNGSEVSRLVTDTAGSATAVIGTTGIAAGTYPGAISVRFEGDDAYAASSATADLVIASEPAALTWNEPAPIVYGTPLSAGQLSATASVPGTFVYVPPAGAVLDAGYQTLSLTFTPNDTTLAPITRMTVLLVTKAASSVSWATPSSIDYGTALTAAQLNATSTLSGTFTYEPGAGTILDVGPAQILRVTFEPDSPNFAPSTGTATIDVAKGRQSVLWDDPQPITVLDPLGPVQLNATVIAAGIAPAGAMTYDPPAGTLLPSGVHTLRVSVAATPQYDAASASADIVVRQVAPLVQWFTPAPIVYGTPLSGAQFNAASDVAGTFTYNHEAGTILGAGSHELFVTFVPLDGRYATGTATVTLQVLKAQQSLSWSNPAPIVYGTPLSAAQLNAIVQVVGPAVPGPLSYTPPLATILQAGAGQTLAVTAEATANYEAATASVTIEVRKATPVITWTAPAPIVYGTPLGVQQLSATADVNGTFDYTPPAGAILDAGAGQTLKVRFTPADTHNYEIVETTRTIDVAKAKQTLTWPAPAPIVYGTPLSAMQLNAQVQVVGPSPAGALTYTPALGTVLDAGTGQTLTVSAAETHNYEPATRSVTIDVRPAPLSLRADPKSKLYGAAVPQLTGTLTGVVNNDPITPSYATTATQQSGAGVYPITGTLVDPNDRLRNYDVTIVNAVLTILPAPLQISANPASKQYSDPLPTLTATYVGFVLGETPAVLGGTLVIQTTADAFSAPGTYPITIGGLVSQNYAISYAGATLTVTPEDARVIITSPLLLSAAASGPTSILLVASVQDISATADAEGDVDPGDIRKAKLTFVDRATGALLCEAPIGLADAADERTGTAMCSITREFATLPSTIAVSASISGYYSRDAVADDVTLTVGAPTLDQVTGGGIVVIASGAGSHRPDAGGDAQFDISIRYDKNNAVTGTFRFSFSRMEGGERHRYLLTPDVMSSLAVRRTSPGGAVMIVARGTLVDSTSKQTIATGVPLIITATETGQKNDHGSLGLSLLKPEGGLWFATGWNGARAVELPVANGNIQVGYGK